MTLANLVPALPPAAPFPWTLGGTTYPSRPLVSGGKLVVPFRVILGNEADDLIVGFATAAVPGGGATVRAEAYFRVLDDSALPGGGCEGAVPDGQGGFYYLWGTRILRVGADGRLAWPTGEQHADYGGAAGRYPSSVRFATVPDADAQAIPLFAADGKGNVLVSWTDYPSGDGYQAFRAQSIGPDGKARWADGGIVVVNGNDSYLYQFAVPDGAGGLLALVPADYYAEQLKLVRYDATGKVARVSAPFAFPLTTLEQPAAAADGRGGLWLAGVLADENGAKRPRLWRWDADDALVCEAAPATADGAVSGLSLSVADAGGDALLGWRTYPEAYEPGDASCRAVIHAVRCALDGAARWGDGARIAVPYLVGQYGSENYDGRVEVLAAGPGGCVGFDGLVPNDASDAGSANDWHVAALDGAGRATAPVDCGIALRNCSSLHAVGDRIAVVAYRETDYDLPAYGKTARPAVPWAGWVE